MKQLILVRQLPHCQRIAERATSVNLTSNSVANYYDSREVEMASKLVGLEFEVYGRVQGVFFRKFTQERGKQLGLKGWCRNTDRGTVLGYMEGEKARVEDMKRWLQYTGSPHSQIEKAEFRDEKEIPQTQFSDFKIKN